MGKHTAVSEYARLVALALSLRPTIEDDLREVAQRLSVRGIESVSATFLSLKGLQSRGVR